VIAGIIGAGLIYWAVAEGFRHGREIDRAGLFQGPIGILVNWIVLLSGIGILAWDVF
jgi:hypothetical protein